MDSSIASIDAWTRRRHARRLVLARKTKIVIRKQPDGQWILTQPNGKGGFERHELKRWRVGLTYINAVIKAPAAEVTA